MYSYLINFGPSTAHPEQRELTKVPSYMTNYPPDMRQSSSFSDYPNPLSDPKSKGDTNDNQGLPKIG